MYVKMDGLIYQKVLEKKSAGIYSQPNII